MDIHSHSPEVAVVTKYINLWVVLLMEKINLVLDIFVLDNK